jgi:hypothetical protein
MVALMRRVLVRLAARYPDRALVIAAALEDPALRRFVGIATEEFGAGFFLLLPQPLPHLLSGLDQASRLQTLALVACAERRISLSRPAGLERWLDQRADIVVELGEPTREADEGRPRRKCVRIEPNSGLQWNFEY